MRIKSNFIKGNKENKMGLKLFGNYLFLYQMCIIGNSFFISLYINYFKYCICWLELYK